MNFNYRIKLDEEQEEGDNKYIEIPFSYKDSNINIKIYQYFISASGIDEQIMFYFRKHLSFKNLNENNIKFQIVENRLILFFKCHMNKNFIITIKHVNNKLFFKLYNNNSLFKRAFCYINKENKKIYENSAQIVFKHLLSFKNNSQYKLKIISEKEIYIFNNNEEFFVSIFDKDILKIKYLYNGEGKARYKYTHNSLYYLNNFNYLDFLISSEDVTDGKIEQIKLSRKLNKF